MSDYRWHDDDYRRGERRSWSTRAGDEVRSWFGDDEARIRRSNDERQDRYPYGGERPWREQGEGSYTHGSSGWRGPRDVGGYEGSREGWGAERFRDSGRGYGDYGRGDYGRGDYGRRERTEFSQSFEPGEYEREEHYQYPRGAQPGWSTLERGQFRRSSGEWTPTAAGSRDWENRGEREPYGWRGRSGYAPGERGHVGSWAGSESYAGRGPKGYRRSDERIHEEVSDILTADPQVDASDVSVQVQDGVVTLSGSVASRDQKRHAEDCVEHISGVSDVTNNLRVNKQDDRHDVSRLVTPSVVPEPPTR